MIKEELDAIRTVAETVIQRPWTVGTQDAYRHIHFAGGGFLMGIEAPNQQVANQIVSAVNAVPILLAHIDLLEAELRARRKKRAT